MVKVNGNHILKEIRGTVMKANGEVIKSMVKVSLFGKAGMFIEENIGKMKEVDKELCIGQTVVNTKVNGLKEFNMVSVK